uniref:Sugar phosphate phosphatase n=1 Tax=Arion vulgaris TaxID=1028688 RepID=A0A0B7AYW8_9EUPU
MSWNSYPPPLSAKDPNSFAYPSMKDRVPIILSKIVDHLTRKRDKVMAEYGGEAGREELKALIGSLSQLRYEVMTNKPAAPLRDSRVDKSEWNTELENQIEKASGEEMKWFDSAWLWMECYLYRRIQEAALMCNLLKNFDVFADQKQAAFSSSYPAVSSLTMYVLEAGHAITEFVPENEIQRYFSEFLQVSLWGNKCDLSISGGSENNQVGCPLEQLTKLKPYILLDDTNKIYQILSKVKEAQGGRGGRVDIVLDNAGFELVTDLCFADFLMTSGLVSEIHFHAKAIPWFVSDVTQQDFHWTLKQMSSMNHIAISQLCRRWKRHLQEGQWVLEVNDFWTMPYDYSQMQERNPSLYDQLSQANFIIFKGDLNYRKLVGDLQWDTTTDFIYSLRGFSPAPLCSLRTLKSDVVVGLKLGQAKEVTEKDPNWMINGEWAVLCVSEGCRTSS